MYNVSDLYKQQLNKGLRNESYVKIVFGVSEPDAPLNSTITDNGHLPYSNSESIDLGFNISHSYNTLERNRFVLDGRQPLPTKDNPTFQGYIGNEISDDDGDYITKPKLVIEFSQFFEFAGLSFKFDTVMNDYPSEFQVICYNNSNIVFSKTLYPTSTYLIISDNIPICNKIELIYLKSMTPHRRARITEIIYGIVDTLTDGEITDFTFENKVELMSTSLPTYSFSFNIFDINGNYSPENPNNLLQFLENGQSVKCSLGQMLDNGTIEWIPIANCFTTGDVSTSNAGFVRTVTVNAESILNFLDMEYNEGVYKANGITLYDMANNIMDFAGYTGTIFIDESLKNIKSKVILSRKPVKECLQIISNCANANLIVTRDGNLAIKSFAETPSGFKFDFGKMLNAPTTNRVPRLRKLTCKYYDVSIEETASELGKATVNFDTETEFILYHNSPATGITITKDTSITNVKTPKKFADKTVFYIKGSGNITVKGKKINYTELEYSKVYNEVGHDLEIENELLDSKESCIRYCDNFAEYLNRRSDYSFEDRGYPHLDLLDDVMTQTNYEGEVNSTIFETSITYNGGLRGKTRTLSY